MSNYEINPAFGLGSTADVLRSRAANFYLTATDCPGGSKVKKQENKIACYGASFRVISPRDAASGVSTGKRIHEPLEVVGKVDKASPKLFDAICTNKNLASVKLEYWGAVTKAEGFDVDANICIYTFELKNAFVADFRHFTHLDGTLCFVAGFGYHDITLTWMQGGITATDAWLAA